MYLEIFVTESEQEIFQILDWIFQDIRGLHQNKAAVIQPIVLFLSNIYDFFTSIIFKRL